MERKEVYAITGPRVMVRSFRVAILKEAETTRQERANTSPISDAPDKS